MTGDSGSMKPDQEAGHEITRSTEKSRLTRLGRVHLPTSPDRGGSGEESDAPAAQGGSGTSKRGGSKLERQRESEGEVTAYDALAGLDKVYTVLEQTWP